MLTVATRVRVVVFLLIAAAVIGHIGIDYARLGRFFGAPGYYVVNLELAETGGLFPDAGVTYRGVTIGRVGDMTLTDRGLVAELRINDSSPPIPAELKAVVSNLSAVGEQYVDLRPSRDEGPFLAAGATIPQSAGITPAPVTELLTSVNALAASVPLNSLRTVVDEMGRAFQGQGPNLRALLDYQSSFVAAADRNLRPTVRLLRDGAFVLKTQNEEGQALRDFGRGAALLAEQLKESDGDLRKVITEAPGATREVAKLIRDLDPGFGLLVANLLTTSDLTYTRQRGMEELFVRLPQVAAIGTTVAQSGSFTFGLTNTFFNPLPCVRGYERTTYRNGLVTSEAPLNTAARCTTPASTGVNVRGSANAPQGGVPEPARPGSLDLGELPGQDEHSLLTLGPDDAPDPTPDDLPDHAPDDSPDNDIEELLWPDDR
ncbi:MCE family protein [Nonomuraea sp. NN258]|uniref:MlaD family protein n=1 Tax=Nonomuraea antri TaxID=2730852 RepID=UPI001569AD0C|nr:MlaD family protein [Nonomuraea antri]NRQ39301.1 MCE family protein [Nonomuraea antri]